MLAAKHIGLQAKRVRTSIERLGLTPLPALAVLSPIGGELSPRIVVLAQCDGQRVLFQDPAGSSQGGRPAIEPVGVYAVQWTFGVTADAVNDENLNP